MERSLEEEEKEKGVHEIRVRDWGFEERVTSIGISEREREREREVRIEEEEEEEEEDEEEEVVGASERVRERNRHGFCSSSCC